MRRTLGVVALGLAGICVQGCILVHTETESVSGPQDGTTREIEAVGKLSFEDSRRSGYERIARRHDLSDAVQAHLVDVATRRLAFEDSRVSVLLTLIKNPCFSTAAETAILKRLHRLSFEQSKVRVLEAISDRKAKRGEEEAPPAQ